MVVVHRQGPGGGRERALRQHVNKEGGLWQRGAARAPSHLGAVPWCSRSRDMMEAVCKVARTTWYRKSPGATGVSRERTVGPCVLLWLWHVLRPSPAEWICAYACMGSPPYPRPCPPSSLSPCLFLSFHPSLLPPNGRDGCLSGNCAVGRRSALGCTGLWLSGHVVSENIHCVCVVLL